MKRIMLLICSLLSAAIVPTACCVPEPPEIPEKPYSIAQGAYGFKKATITNIATKEAVEKTFDDIIDDKIEFLQLGWMLGLGVGITPDTEFIFTMNNRCFTLNEDLLLNSLGIIP